MSRIESTVPLISPALLAWWERHGRKDLPWQQDPSPYRVWVSEIMLQQTQVTTVVRYYDAFLAAFPTVTALANAEADAVLHQWSGLGYYARARNLHKAAGIVRDQHGGQVPESFEVLAELPGIGRSTAGAILALSRNEPHPILDGNVKRVLSRVFRVEGFPSESAVARRLWDLAERCTPADRAAHYTQAIMDLGATLCARRRPACDLCPLAEGCQARAAGVQDTLPARKKLKVRPERSTVVMLCLRPDGAVLLERRPEAGLWGGLWGLPETNSVEEAGEWCTTRFGIPPAETRVRPVLRHGFTHFELHMTPVELHLKAAPHGIMEPGRWLWFDATAPARVGLAAPVARLIDSLAR